MFGTELWLKMLAQEREVLEKYIEKKDKVNDNKITKIKKEK